MPRKATGRSPRKPEVGFTVAPEEKARIAAAAEKRKLLPSTYMKQLVLAAVERDLADAAAQAAAEAEAPPDAPGSQGPAVSPEREVLSILAQQVSAMAATLSAYLENPPRTQNS